MPKKSQKASGVKNETPLMQQYNSIKSLHPDKILLFRMGDFYEMFGDDAKKASKILGITLTSRNKDAGDETPLAGFPYHALDNYLAKLLNANLKVAICEQVEDPKKAKGIVKREVVQIITPGTILEDKFLNSNENNYLFSIYPKDKKYGISGIDISTGEFFTFESPADNLLADLDKYEFKEIILPRNSTCHTDILLINPNLMLTEADNWYFDFDSAYSYLTQGLNVVSLEGFGIEHLKLGICAAGALLRHISSLQAHELNHISRISCVQKTDYMFIDSGTKRNLELTAPIRSENTGGTLLSTLDNTCTPMGARLLKKWLLHPLKDSSLISKRFDAVEDFYNNPYLREELLPLLKQMGDLERLNSKIVCARANGRDIISLANSLKLIPFIKDSLVSARSKLLEEVNLKIDPMTSIVEKISSTIVPEPPLSIKQGGLIKDGINEGLDELRSLTRDNKLWIVNFQNREKEKTGVNSLKVGFNKVFGYYIEISKSKSADIPENYIRKQTLVNSERFITEELKEYEEKILSAEEKMKNIEFQIFDTLREEISEYSKAILNTANMISILDVILNFAFTSLENNYKRPALNDFDLIEINNGRHPVVEKLVRLGEFIPNSTNIDCSGNQIQIITGPNMAGKSTYLRQVALIVLMAQVGCYIPADSANIGIVDRIFTRVGASDNLSRGESTFLVEMNETANILNNATKDSLIILDEIGRGTSTFDGLSLAWAVVEYIHNFESISAKTLFATHYHELTEMELLLPNVKNYHISVKEWNNEIIFLRKVIPGTAQGSYGIQVAKLAGLPESVIDRAKEVLANLEENELTPSHKPKLARNRRQKNDDIDLNLFMQPIQPKKKTKPNPVLEKIKKIDINSLSPIEALNFLNSLKKELSDISKPKKK